MRVLIFLFVTFSFSARAELNLIFDYGSRHYELVTNKGELTFKSPATKLSVVKKDCNSKAYDSFVKRYVLMLGKYPHRRVSKGPTKKDFNKVLYKMGGKATQFLAMPQSELGQHFLKLPQSIAQLKRVSLLSCEKPANKSK